MRPCHLATPAAADDAELERHGNIHVAVGEDYAEKALNWLMDQYVKDEAS